MSSRVVPESQPTVAAKKYLSIISRCESWLHEHGDSHLGVGWPNKDDALVRYRVMLDVRRPRADGEAIRLLDFGCGASHLLEYIKEHDIRGVEYSGLDLSPEFIALSRLKFPANAYYRFDVLDDDAPLGMFDYIVMNGVFTFKGTLTFEEMLEYFTSVLERVFTHAREGIAFNVMSKQVDWERDDLFHLPLDTLAGFVVRHLTRNFVVRNDYGLYEYTVYVYR